MKREGEHPLGDAGQMICFGFFLVIWAGDSFFLRVSTVLSDDVPFSIRLALLVAAIVPALYLARSGHSVVSHKQVPDRIVSDGAFRYVRHPLYLASLLTYFGLAVSTVSLFSLALMVVIALFHNTIAAYEERFLEQKYWESYGRYKRSTGKWLPKLGKKR